MITLKLAAIYSLVCISCVALCGFTKASAQKIVHDIALQNVDGKMVSFSQYKDAKGFIVIFTSNRCPFARLYTDRLNAFHAKYKTKSIPVIAINSMDTTITDEESYTEMIKAAKNRHFEFPYLYDPLQKAAKDFGAMKTPHVFVLWKKDNNWVVKYNGAIDDNGAEPGKVKEHYLADAVEALLAGKEPALKEMRSVGCAIHYRK